MDSDRGSDGEPVEQEHGVGEQYNLTEDGGVKKTILELGDGFQYPDANAEVQVSYKGQLEDGTVFDESQMFTFTLGKGEVVKGWDVAVASMKHFETSEFVMSPAYAYGAEGSPPEIPPNATLKFEIKVLSWCADVDISGRGEACLYKRSLSGGPSYDEWIPQRRFAALVTYSVRDVQPADATIEAVDHAQRRIGYGKIQNRGVEQALKKLKVGEVARVRADAGCKYLQVRDPELLQWVDPPRPDGVSFEVELHSVEEDPPDHWSLEKIDEMLDYSNKYREQGTDHYKAKRVWIARKFYRRAADYLASDFHVKDPAEKDILRAAKETVALNLMAVALALGKTDEVREQCEKVFQGKTGIVINASAEKPAPRAHSVACIKALLRRAKASIKDGHAPEAGGDVRKAQHLIAAYSPAVAQAPLPKEGELEALKKEAEVLEGVVKAAEAAEEADAKRRLKGRVKGILG